MRKWKHVFENLFCLAKQEKAPKRPQKLKYPIIECLENWPQWSSSDPSDIGLTEIENKGILAPQTGAAAFMEANPKSPANFSRHSKQIWALK